MAPHLVSLHHVTATVDDAQADLDFYVKLLGLRLVKKTVNFDNTSVYHFYYGTEHGTPGTIMTTFPYKGKGVRVGEKGAGQITATSFSVPTGSLAWWRARLAQHGVTVREGGGRLGEEVIVFDDPSGLILELIANDGDDRTPWRAEGVDEAYAIRGFHSVTLALHDLEKTRHLLENVLGFEVVGEEGNRVRLGVHGGGAGKMLDLVHLPEAARGVNGLGTVHHVALAITSDEEQRALREDLLRLGYKVTEVRDRQYFRSIYFREPGGVLLEVATIGPGFAIDETVEALGQSLKLPPWEEPLRNSIEAALAEVS